MEMRIKCSSQQTVQITDMFRICIYLPFNSFSIYGVQSNVLSRYWHKPGYNKNQLHFSGYEEENVEHTIQ